MFSSLFLFIISHILIHYNLLTLLKLKLDKSKEVKKDHLKNKQLILMKLLVIKLDKSKKLK